MKKSISITILFCLILLFGCTKPAPRLNTEKRSKIKGTDWRNVQLQDVKTGKKFKISDFKGKPVLLESFAVWCPTCKKQQDQIKKLHKQVGDKVISISIDTDPNENKAKVIQHIDRYGYDWRFAVVAKEFSQKLVNEFGVNVVNAPSAPIVLIDSDQKARLLRFGIKDAEELKKEVDGA